MGILVWLLIGAVVGALAGMIMGEGLGLIGNIVVGIVGSAIGGMLFAHGDINNSPLTVGTFAVSLIGSIVLLAIVNLVRRGRLT
ncbi:MAG: GlsB/YeaQ/YmgE family stress response membrane protein [Sphingomonadales bacterium]|nr:GlsB/YeaQ/YmgE family stress response membrane protein [Sphingomonadales bacterium]MDE2169154.1 GlsB/YeaQ/YmgE family stress response membrane protein [Sphingomonadales bacterium]